MSELRKQISAAPSAMPNRTIRFVISDETLDRQGDIVDAGGWDFSEFKKNPQFLGFHNDRDFPIGKPTRWEVDTKGKRVLMDVYFPTIAELSESPELASEKAKIVDTTYHMYKTGMLNAVSVKFLSTEAVDHPAEFVEKNPLARYGRRSMKHQLWEVSAVPIPADPNALVAMKGMSCFDKAGIDIMEREIKEAAMDTAENIPEVKANRSLSKRTLEKLEGLRATIEGCHNALKELMAGDAGGNGEGEEDGDAQPAKAAEPVPEAPAKIEVKTIDGLSVDDCIAYLR
jgi:hypothetical protein